MFKVMILKYWLDCYKLFSSYNIYYVNKNKEKQKETKNKRINTNFVAKISTMIFWY